MTKTIKRGIEISVGRKTRIKVTDILGTIVSKNRQLRKTLLHSGRFSDYYRILNRKAYSKDITQFINDGKLLGYRLIGRIGLSMNQSVIGVVLTSKKDRSLFVIMANIWNPIITPVACEILTQSECGKYITVTNAKEAKACDDEYEKVIIVPGSPVLGKYVKIRNSAIKIGMKLCTDPVRDLRGHLC